MFIKGMDISSHPEMMDKGYRYYDFDGNEVNIIDFAKEQGFNYGRIRIWNNPGNVEESGGYCSLAHTKRMAAEIKKRGMGFLLDFHYSDFWADPGQQNKPLAWSTLHGDALEKAVYDYTKEVLEALDRDGLYPDMVQVGNEIRCGMMWPDGSTNNWDGLSALLNAGIRAVRDTQRGRGVKIMLHLDQGGRFYYFKEWFDNALSHGVTDFDIIGLSYYPFWHGTFYDLKNSMEELVKRYHRPLIIAEAAHAYRRSSRYLFVEAQERISGFPAGGDAQRKVLELIMSIAAHVSDGKGLGIFYWEPFSRTDDEEDDSWGSCMGIVDQEGRPTPGFKAFGFDPHGADTNQIAKIYEPPMVTVTEKDHLAEHLPETVKVLKYDGTLEREEVRWASAEAELIKNETVVITGTLPRCGKDTAVSVLLVDKKEKCNLLENADFGNVFGGVPERWEIAAEAAEDGLTHEIQQEVSGAFPFDAVNYYYFKGNGNFKFTLCQKVSGLRAGNYAFSLSYRGDNTTGVKVWLYAKTEDGTYVCKDVFPSADGWASHKVEFALAGDMQAEVGISVDAPAIYGMVKDLSLFRKEA